jgi:hypothetical protein
MGVRIGDLRNKLAKQARDEAHRQYMAKHHPPKPAPEPPKCLCGLTCYEAPTLWAIDGGGWPRRVDYYCPACLPHDLRGKVAKGV